MSSPPDIAELYELHGKLIFNLCLHYLKNREDAEEVCQNVFVKAHFALAEFRGESSVKTWLYAIAVRQCLDHLKKKNRKKRFAIFTPGMPEFSDFSHPGVELEQTETFKLIFQLLDQLPESQKTALILHKIEGLSIREVAEILGLKEKAADSLIHRAKANFREKWNKTKDI